jgi:hypothetical protein
MEEKQGADHKYHGQTKLQERCRQDRTKWKCINGQIETVGGSYAKVVTQVWKQHKRRRKKTCSQMQLVSNSINVITTFIKEVG